jgi:RNA polymerase sigma-70 factor (sigma-E family)
MGGEQDLAAFVAARGPALLRLAWLLTADGPAAEDLVQDALARAIPRWRSIAPGAHEAYLRAAIRSVWIDTWRRRRVRGGLDVVTDLGASGASGAEPMVNDSAVEGTADRLTVGAALARLTARQRAVLVLRFYEDQTERETARALGISVNTVKSQTRHALDRLRTLAPELAEAFGRAEPDPRAEPEPHPPGTTSPSASLTAIAEEATR